MACGITDPLGCVGQLVGGTASSAWDAICLSFATAADALLKAFARAFTAIPPVDLTSPGVKNVYAICLGIAAVIAALLLLGQVIRTAFTHDGSALAEGLAGIGKAAAAFLLTLAVASAAVTAADSLTGYIVSRSFGSAAALTARITTLVSFTGSPGHPGTELAGGASLLLLLAIIGILLILVLWFELLLRNAAIAVLVATSPIAAAGMAAAPGRSWWPKMATATGQLIILKPAIALIFALGLELTGTSHDIETLLAGMLILLLAVVAWPVIARFFTFTSVGLSGSTGLGMILGFAAARLASSVSTTRTGMPGGQAAAGSAAAGAATAGVLGLAAAGVRAAHRMTTALAGQMDQVAGHAGFSPAGYGYQAGQGWTPQARSARQGFAQRQRARSPQAAPGDSDWDTGQWPADWPDAEHGPAPDQAGLDWPDLEADPWTGGNWPAENPAPITGAQPGLGPETPGSRPAPDRPAAQPPSASPASERTVPPAEPPGSPGEPSGSPEATGPGDDEREG